MKTRYKMLSYYGISQEEGKVISIFCRFADDVTKRKIKKIVKRSIPASISEMVVSSLIDGKGYEALIRENFNFTYYKADFYGYKRKAIAEIKRELEKDMEIKEQLQIIQAQIEQAKQIGAQLDNKIYQVDGVSCSWDLVVDGEKAYQGIEKGIGLTKRLSFVKACHELYESKMAFVDKVNKKMKEQEKKERYEKMEKNNFKRVFIDLKAVFEEAGVEAIDLFEQFGAIEKKWINRPQMSDELYAIENGKYLSAKKEHEENLKALAESTNMKVKKLREELQLMADRYYKMDPAKMDTKAVELLRLGILNADDIRTMSKDYANNPTMLTVIERCLDKSKPDMSVVATELAMLNNSKKEMSAFDELCNRGKMLYSKEHWERTAGNKTMFLFDSAIERASDFEIAE